MSDNGSVYRPNNWVVLKMSFDGEVYYKVLAGWSGGFLDGDSWRMNSGITRVTHNSINFGEEEWYEFYGYSGSTYECGVNSYGLKMNNAHIYEQLKEKYGDAVELMPENTNWLTLLKNTEEDE